MNATKFLGLAVLTVAVSGIAQAAPTAKKGVRVVEGATALSTADKANITGMHHCGCDTPPPTEPEPTPTEPSPTYKPGWGFGAKTEHYGPPGQGFTNDKNWRGWLRSGGWAADPYFYDQALTPKGNHIPNKAFEITGAPRF